MYKKILIFTLIIAFVGGLMFINSISNEQTMQKIENSNDSKVLEKETIEIDNEDLTSEIKEEEKKIEEVKETEEVVEKKIEEVEETKVEIKEDVIEKKEEPVLQINEQETEEVKETIEEVDKNVNEVIQITAENFETEILKSDKITIVDFYADWCGPCQIQSPIMEELAKENYNIKVGKLNVDEQNDLDNKYAVIYIPTLILFKDGEEVDKRVGLTSKEDILEMLNNIK